MKLKLTLVCSTMAVFLGGLAVGAKATPSLGPDLPLIGNAPLAFKLDKAGKLAAEAGNIREARIDYQQALAACFTDETATLGVARCAVAEGDLTTAITCYRSAIYGHREDYDIDLLTEYILVLNQAGQGQEAVSLYNHVVDLCKKGYCVNKMEIAPQVFHLDGSDYVPARLQAMTHLIRALNSGNGEDKRILFETQKAITLAPDASIVYFYKGVLLSDTDKSGAKAAFQQALDKAAEAGDNKTATTVKERLKVLR